MKETTNIIKNLAKEIPEIVKQKNFKIILVILIFNIILIGIIIYFFLYNKNENIYVNEFDSASEVENFQELTENNKTENIIIYITGEVNKPGVYELNEDSRIIDAIEIAEGTTVDADLRKINLAYQLSDSEKIEIPSIKQEEIGNNEIKQESYMENDNNSKLKKININTADISELTTLPGIGESTARKIINYRQENGKFKDIEDIKNVSGIGESKYNEIKEFIKLK